MKAALTLLATIVFSSCWFRSAGQNAGPDTVTVGIYITSVHDIDFRQKEYSMNLWLWLKYRRPEFDFMKNLEVPMAKTVEKSYATLDTLEDGRIYALMKLQCVMKGIWRINDFPFDLQRLRFSIENSMYDTRDLVFAPDTAGEHYGKYFLTSWEKEGFEISTDVKEYETAFGDPTLPEPYAEYSAYKVVITIHRHSWELFLKLFLGMYISFFISSVCFRVHPDGIDARLALSVGSLFAVIGNKYIIDSTLPESNSFTLVDTLHALTLFYIFVVITLSIYNQKLFKKDPDRALRFDKIAGVVMLLLYLAANACFIFISKSAGHEMV